jgi:hypothetical protein
VTRIVFCLLLVAGCGGEDEPRRDSGPAVIDPEPDPDPDPQPNPEYPQEVHLFKRSRPMMGTIYEITVAGVPDDQASGPVQRAMNEIARL